MMKSVTCSVGCCFVLVWRMGEGNELTGHSKDRGKDRPNSRTNSLQHGENDADQSCSRGPEIELSGTTIDHKMTCDRS
jgi:hypothetical protein